MDSIKNILTNHIPENGIVNLIIKMSSNITADIIIQHGAITKHEIVYEKLHEYGYTNKYYITKRKYKHYTRIYKYMVQLYDNSIYLYIYLIKNDDIYAEPIYGSKTLIYESFKKNILEYNRVHYM